MRSDGVRTITGAYATPWRTSLHLAPVLDPTTLNFAVEHVIPDGG